MFVPATAGRVLSHRDTMAALAAPAGARGGGTVINIHMDLRGTVDGAAAGKKAVEQIKQYGQSIGVPNKRTTEVFVR
jgi:hypothetical protein